MGDSMSTIINATTTNGVVIQPDNSGSLQLATNSGTTALTIDTSQNVGIGTSSFALSAAGRGDLEIAGSSTAVVGLKGGSNQAYVFNDGTNVYVANASASGNIVFQPATNTESMRIDSSGNVGIGTSGINNGKTSILFGGATANAIEAQDSGTNSGAGFLSCRNSSGTQIGSITRVSTTNAVAFNTTSDERLKSNIENTEPVLDKLMTVKVRQFDWTDGNLHQDAGFIAQELAPILSGIVTEGKTEDDVWQLDYSRLTPYLTKAIQEQQTIINDLKARIETLEAK
jgi:hypothetical protein